MPVAFIPPLLRDLTGGTERVEVEGQTVRQIVAALETRFPGILGRLCVGDELRPGLAVAINGTIGRAGLLQPVAADAEVHFLPAIGGG